MLRIMETRIVSWNVNGIRAAQKKGLLEYMMQEHADVVCLQETKAKPEQLDEQLLSPSDYCSYFSSAERGGYSGVAVYSRRKPLSVSPLGIAEFDAEGRALLVEFPDFVLINGYFPNSQSEGARLDYKLAYCDAILKRCNSLVGEGRHVVVCGDYNIAHEPIDLARPKENEGNPGFLPEERAWMSSFLDAGYTDTFRIFNNEGGNYTWWSYRTKGRERNVGWRLDYFCTDKGFENRVRNSEIRSEIMGSDHCPVVLTVAE
ncbi:exodeoxyribonuclease III [Sediminispirochaeta bajacaliforniensis]|uniref:exodeoxyribonuclease III n=1 Tax=Sediminispirochaeta bajacaliforniensis TaxID=148 RepID=UPI0003810489